MSDLFYLLSRYLWFYRTKVLTLSFSLALVIAIPLGLSLLSNMLSDHLKTRALSTPLLLGAKGSALDLSIAALYFGEQELPLMKYQRVEELRESNLTKTIPIYRKYRVKSSPIVGTDLDYFDFRDLSFKEGRPFIRIGECVLGSDTAKKLDVKVGDTLVSSPESVFDIAGAYPLKMDVVGILAPSLSADDLAVFTDIKTSWIIEGLAHGHEKLEKTPSAILKREGETLIANASVMQYNYITQDNIEGFHFHGNIDTFPINAIILIPEDHKAKTLLMGRYMSDHASLMLIEPKKVIQRVLERVFDIKDVALSVLLLLLAATFAISVLVFTLSIRLRKNEIETLKRIGVSRFKVNFLLLSEIITVILISTLLVFLSIMITYLFGDSLIYYFL